MKALRELASDDLSSSGLDLTTLKDFVALISQKELRRLFGRGNKSPIEDALGALEFKYFTPDPFSRYKIYWEPLKGFAAHAKDSRPKYLQLPGTPPNPYIPPHCTNWDTFLADAAASLVITEGEKKALALNQRGIPAIGLGGVNSFTRTALGEPLLLELKRYVAGRRVYVVFDIDSGRTSMAPLVARAALSLSSALADLGAKPFIVTLPADGTTKCGVDDFLLERPLATAMELLEIFLEHSALHKTAESLYEEARRYIYINDTLTLGNLETRGVISLQEYRSTRSHIKVPITVIGVRKSRSGTVTPTQKIELKPLSDLYLEWPARPVVKRITYQPGVADPVTPDNEFNMWRGWAQPLPDKVAERDVAPLRHAFDALYKTDADFMWGWFMYPIAVPQGKLVVVPVIQSEREGVGKSSIPLFFAKFIYGMGPGTPGNATTLNAMSLRDGRLEFAAQKQFLFLDDANDIHGNDVEALLKNLATTDSIHVNPKYLHPYDCRNIVNLCITTNRTMPFRVSSEDRRLFFPIVADTVPPRVWDDLHRWGREHNGGGIVTRYAQTLFDVKSVNPSAAAPLTAKKEGIIDVARSGFENFLHELRLAAEAGALARNIFTVRELRALAEREGEVRSATDITSPAMARAAKLVGAQRYGGETFRIRLRSGAGGSLETFYAFAELERWRDASTAEVLTAYEEIPLDRVRLGKPEKASKVVKMVPGGKKY